MPSLLRETKMRDRRYFAEIAEAIIDDDFYGDFPANVRLLSQQESKRLWRPDDRLQMMFFPDECVIAVMHHFTDEKVPEYFVKYILFHEVLHAFLSRHHGYRGHLGAFQWIVEKHPHHESASNYLTNSEQLKAIERKYYQCKKKAKSRKAELSKS